MPLLQFFAVVVFVELHPHSHHLAAYPIAESDAPESQYEIRAERCLRVDGVDLEGWEGFFESRFGFTTSDTAALVHHNTA